MTTMQLISPGYYAQVLTRLLGEPGRFFSDMGHRGDLYHAVIFLVFTSFFHSAAGLIQLASSNPVIEFGILFFNGICMACLGAVILFSALTMVGRKIRFAAVFSIVAYGSGVALLVSWVPFFIWLTEPWKWALIFLGLTRGCEFKWWQALGAITVTLLLLFLFFSMLFPALLS